LTENQFEQLKSLFSEYRNLNNQLYFNNYPFLKKAVSDIFHNRMHIWDSAKEQFDAQIKVYEENMNSFDASLVELDNIPIRTVQIINNQLIELFENGK